MPPSSLVSARSAASTAGWVIAVWRKPSSARATAAASLSSTKMKSMSGLPSIGVITRSASAKVSATIGSASRSARSMFTYCEPWPVYRKRHLRRGSVAAKDTLRPQRLPDCRLAGRQRLQRLSRFVGQVGGIRVVDRQPFRRAQIGFRGNCHRRRAARLGGCLHRAQTLGQAGLRSGSDHQRSAQRHLSRRRRVPPAACRPPPWNVCRCR